MERPRRVPFEFEYKSSRDKEKERERENDIDPFGMTNPDFLNPSEEPNDQNVKLGENKLSWLDDVDDLPSRRFNNESQKTNELNKDEKNDFHNLHKNMNFHDRNNDNNLKEKEIKEELELEKIKVNRLQSEIKKLKNIKETINTKNILHFINIISFNSLGLGKKIGQGGYSEIYESQWLGIPVAVKVIFDPK